MAVTTVATVATETASAAEKTAHPAGFLDDVVRSCGIPVFHTKMI